MAKKLCVCGVCDMTDFVIADANKAPRQGRWPSMAAGPGWDACTGWGSPNGLELVKALSA
jgi:hypothetical protein